MVTGILLLFSWIPSVLPFQDYFAKFKELSYGEIDLTEYFPGEKLK